MSETIKNNENLDSEENLYSTLQDEPSFEEHIQEMNEYNAKQLTRLSLKNEELKDGAGYASLAVDGLSKKIKNGEKLTADDITALTNEKGFFEHADDIKDYLTDVGFNDGTDFDIKLPGKIVTKEGRQEDLPLSISFSNGKDFTRVNIYRDQDGKATIDSWSGKGNEGVDVGYQGPVSADYHVENYQSAKFE